MKNLLFHSKAVKTGAHKAQVGVRAGSGAGAGAESNSFGSATLAESIRICRFCNEYVNHCAHS